jgi:hypothetical protein
VVAKDPKTTWLPITVSNCYCGGERTVEIVSNTATWYSTGLPAVELRWVLIRDPQEEEEFETQALLCTNLSADPECVIWWFVRRLSDGEHLSGTTPTTWLRDPEVLV